MTQTYFIKLSIRQAINIENLSKEKQINTYNETKGLGLIALPTCIDCVYDLWKKVDDKKTVPTYN